MLVGLSITTIPWSHGKFKSLWHRTAVVVLSLQQQLFSAAQPQYSSVVLKLCSFFFFFFHFSTKQSWKAKYTPSKDSLEHLLRCHFTFFFNKHLGPEQIPFSNLCIVSIMGKIEGKTTDWILYHIVTCKNSSFVTFTFNPVFATTTGRKIFLLA